MDGTASIKETLHNTDSRSQAVLDAIPDSMFYFSDKGQLLDYTITPADAILAIIPNSLSRPPGSTNEVQAPAKLLTDIRQRVGQVAREQVSLNFEFDLEAPPDVVTFEARLVPVDNLNEVLVLMRNITLKKKAESQLVRTERLAALGQMATALAHEINNPLQAMQANLDLVLDFPLSVAETRQTLRILSEEIERLRDVARRILSYSRPGTTTRQQLTVTNLIKRMLSLTSKQLERKQILIETDFQETPAVIVNPGQMLQVFLNLVINAIDAAPPREARLHISVKNIAGEVVINFVNNGASISPQVLPYVFEPFFTTKHEGNGLGLWVSHTIVQQHGGSLIVENLANNEGVRFSVYLPASGPPHQTRL